MQVHRIMKPLFLVNLWKKNNLEHYSIFSLLMLKYINTLPGIKDISDNLDYLIQD